MYTFDRLAEEVNALSARLSTLEGKADLMIALSIAYFASMWVFLLALVFHLGGI